ncbi:hypothetical protein PSHT_04990 [Puccinia striiformis]|uniref:Uncharacterized protein n=1 Tax=Puccinia striiformis TaxID=27350 RepID=A0A2S4WBP7_9BASI|nr:hypothetical protein PSHT_04990 [Puccinia striiformis]
MRGRLEGTREAMRVGMQKRGSSSFVKKLTKGLKAGSPGKGLPKKVAFKGPAKDFDSSSASPAKTKPTSPTSMKSSRDTAKVPVDKKSDDPTSKNNEPSENRPASSEAEEKTTTATKEEDKKDKSSPLVGPRKRSLFLNRITRRDQNESTRDLFDTSTLPKFKTEEPDSVEEDIKDSWRPKEIDPATVTKNSQEYVIRDETESVELCKPDRVSSWLGKVRVLAECKERKLRSKTPHQKQPLKTLASLARAAAQNIASMPPNNSSNIPALRRSGSSASVSTPADPRTTRSSTLHTSQTAQQAPTGTTRSRFGFPSSTSNNANNQTNIPNGPENTNQTAQPQLRKSTRTSSSSASHIARPASALGRPASSLGTHSTVSVQNNSRLPQSSNIPAPNRKRRTSSVSSQRPAPFGHTPASNPTRPSESLPSTEVQKQLTEALDKLSGTQEECTQWKTRAEEVELRIEQCEKDQYEERISFCEEIKQLEDQHAETVQQIKNDLGAQLTRAQEEIESLMTSSAKYQEDLQKSNAQVDRLHSEIEQMDVDSGRSAAQVMELTRLKTELETKLEASQNELDQNTRANQNRVDQVSEHYHNIQSKLHQDLEQMTADYQASLEKQEHSPSPELLLQSTSQHEQEKSDLETQLSRAKQTIDELKSSTIPQESHAETLDNLKNTEAELENLKSQLKSVNALIADLRKRAYDTEKEQTTAQIASRDEFESLQSDLETQLSRAKQTIDELKSSTIPQESYAATLDNLTNTEAELENLKSELESVNGLLADLRKTAYDTEKEQTTAQIASRDEFESVQSDLETQLSSAKQAIEDMTSSTVPLENHEKILEDLKTLESELSSLKSELLSSQETCQVASNNLTSSQQIIRVLEDSLRALKNDSVEKLDRLSQVHAQEIAASAEQIKHLQVDLDQLNNAHAQTLSKLDELSAFNPQQISILTSRLREERNESRRAIDFMQVERQTLEDTSRDLISNLQFEQQQILHEAAAERNTLVVALVTLQSALKSWKQVSSLDHHQISEGSGVEASTKAEEAPIEDSRISLASHLRADFGLDRDDGLETLEIDGHEGSDRIDPQAYETALDQVALLTKQVDDLKEQLIQTYVAHEEQEKLALHDLDKTRSELLLSKEQHSRLKNSKPTLEESYNALRKDNEKLNSGIELESEKSKQLEMARESMQATTNSLRSQIESMNVEIQTYKQQISDLQENHSLANEDLLTHDLEQQKKFTETLEDRLEAAVLIQNEHLASVKQLEETLHVQKDDSKVELESKEAELIAQKSNSEKQLSELQNALDEQSARNMRLQENVNALTTQIQEEQDIHRTIQAESEAKLSEAIQNRSTVDEKYQRLENHIEELLEKTKALEEENGSLNNQLEVATEEQEANKEKTATELSRTKEQLAEMNQDVRLLTGELEQLRSEQELGKQSSEKYQTLLSEFKALEEQLPALSSELEVVRSELESATGMVEDMTSEVKEKDSMINQLEADLATANKSHESVSSTDDPMTMEQVRELEERVKSKTAEAEDAVDKLIEEMQRNKRLSNLVEMLKIKLKSRAKPTSLPSEQRAPQESSEDPPRAEPSSSAPEPDDQPASSSSRKRKHEPTTSEVAGTRLRIQINDDENDVKENPSGTNGRQPIRRKISGNTEDEDRQDDSNSKTDENRNDNIGVLKPVSINQQNTILSTTTTTDSTKETLKVTIKPPTTTTSTTNATLLASIQSLRRKQQLQKQQQQQQQQNSAAASGAAGAGASKVQLSEPRRSSLRLVRKDQENP